MFIQVIRGHVADTEAFRAVGRRWEDELAPGAAGLLGSTAGVAEDGTAIIVVRFESAEAAQQNSDRPEQTAFFEETSTLYDGEVTFYDCPTVDALLSPSDEAGFVQVTTCKVSDVPAARRFGADFAKIAPSVRPDLLGFTDAYTDDGRLVTTSYFVSEAAAREGESKELPPEHQEVFAGFRALVSDFEYFDLANPRLFSPA